MRWQSLGNLELMNKNVVRLVFLVPVFACTNMFWLSYDSVPQHWDSGNHILSALKYHDVISDYLQEHDWLSIKIDQGGMAEVARGGAIGLSSVIPFVGSFMIFLAGSSIKWLVMTKVLFMAILIYALHRIGKRVPNEEAGILACTHFGLYPMVFNTSRDSC